MKKATKMFMWLVIILNLIVTSGFVMSLYQASAIGSSFATKNGMDIGSPLNSTLSMLSMLVREWASNPFNIANKDVAFVTFTILFYAVPIFALALLKDKKEK